MKKLFALPVVALLVLGLIGAPASANTQSDPPATVSVTTQASDPVLITVWNDDDFLYVRYEAAPGWCLSTTAAPVIGTRDQVPVATPGTPITTHPIETTEHGCVPEYTYSLPMQWEVGMVVYGSAHAVACESLTSAQGVGLQTKPDCICQAWSTCFWYEIRGKTHIEWPEGGTITVAYEDLPILENSDYDYNDWVVDIDTTATYDQGGIEQPNLLELAFNIRPMARGAGYYHAFHMVIPANTFAGSGSYVMTLYDGSGNVLETTTGAFDPTVENDYLVIPSTMDALPGRLPNTIEPAGVVSHFPTLTNTDPAAPQHEPYIPAQRLASLTITFDELYPFDLTLWDPYDPGNVHGEGLFFAPYLHVFNWDGDVGPGDPRMLAIPADWDWPEAAVRTWMAYPDVIAGNPPTFTEEWWLNYNDLVYSANPQ